MYGKQFDLIVVHHDCSRRKRSVGGVRDWFGSNRIDIVKRLSRRIERSVGEIGVVDF